MLHIAIREIHNSISLIHGNNIDNVICTDKNGKVVEIDKTKVKAKEKELIDAKEAIAYKQARQIEYPPIGDQLDDLFKQGAFSADMKAKIKKVKDDNPKG